MVLASTPKSVMGNQCSDFIWQLFSTIFMILLCSGWKWRATWHFIDRVVSSSCQPENSCLVLRPIQLETVRSRTPDARHQVAPIQRLWAKPLRISQKLSTLHAKPIRIIRPEAVYTGHRDRLAEGHWSKSGGTLHRLASRTIQVDVDAPIRFRTSRA